MSYGYGYGYSPELSRRTGVAIPNKADAVQAFGYTRAYFDSDYNGWKIKDLIGKVDRDPLKGYVYNYSGTAHIIFNKTDIDFSGDSFFDIECRMKKASGDQLIISQADDTNNRVGLYWFTDDRIYLIACNSGNSTAYTAAITDFSRPIKVRVRYDGTESVATDRATIWIDDVEQSISYFGTLPSTLPTFTEALKFGRASTDYSDGLMGDVKIRNSSGVIINSWHCDENGSGACYDSIGVVNGVFTNTTSAFFEESLLFRSYINEFGATISGGAYIPIKLNADETPTSLDVKNNTPTFLGRTRNDVKIVKQYYGDFDGDNDYATLTNFPSVACKKIYGRFAPASEVASNCVCEFGSFSVAGLRVIVNSSDGLTLQLFRSGFTETIDSGITLSDGVWVDWSIEIDETDKKITFTVDSTVSEVNYTNTFVNDMADTSAIIGDGGGLTNFEGGMSYIGLETTGKNYLWKFSNATGTTIYDSVPSDGTYNPINAKLFNVNLSPNVATSFWKRSYHARPNNRLDGCTEGIRCRVRGNSFKECNNAYGEWEWGFIKNSDAWIISRIFISGTNDVFPNYDSAYLVYITTGEQIVFYRANGGTLSALFSTTASFVQVGVPYKIKCFRNSVENEYVTGAIGTFAFYIKGGSFGDDYVLITAASGSNPVTDNTYPTSEFCGIDCDASDVIFDSSHNGVKEDFDDYSPTTGSFTKTFDPVFFPTNEDDRSKDVLGFDASNPTGSWNNGSDDKYEQPEVPELYDADYQGGNDISKYWFGIERLEGTLGSHDFQQLGKYKFRNDGVSDDSPRWEFGTGEFALGTKILFVYQISNYVSGSIVPRVATSNLGVSRSANGFYSELVEVTSFVPGSDRVDVRGSSFVGDIELFTITVVNEEDLKKVSHYNRNYNVYDGDERNNNFSDAEQNKWRKNLLYKEEQTGDDLTKIQKYTNATP